MHARSLPTGEQGGSWQRPTRRRVTTGAPLHHRSREGMWRRTNTMVHCQWRTPLHHRSLEGIWHLREGICTTRGWLACHHAYSDCRHHHYRHQCRHHCRLAHSPCHGRAHNHHRASRLRLIKGFGPPDPRRRSRRASHCRLRKSFSYFPMGGRRRRSTQLLSQSTREIRSQLCTRPLPQSTQLPYRSTREIRSIPLPLLTRGINKHTGFLR